MRPLRLISQHVIPREGGTEATNANKSDAVSAVINLRHVGTRRIMSLLFA